MGRGDDDDDDDDTSSDSESETSKPTAAVESVNSDTLLTAAVSLDTGLYDLCASSRHSQVRSV